MSETQEIVALLDGLNVMNYCSLSAIAFVFYEHLITLDSEIDLIWRGKRTGSKMLFLLSRYVVLANCILQLFLIAPAESAMSCQAMNVLSMIIDLTQYSVVLGFSALRAYAISGRYWVPPTVILFLLSVAIGINLYAYKQSVYAEVVNLGVKSVCNWGSILSDVYATMLSYLTCSITITCDMIVLVITWCNTFKVWRHGKRNKLDTSLTQLLLVDGTVHFVLLTALTIFSMSTSNLPNNSIIQSDSYFQATIPNIIICRFLINLRKLDSSGSTTDSESQGPDHSVATGIHWARGGQTDSLRFRSALVGNMGETLDDGFTAREQDDET